MRMKGEVARVREISRQNQQGLVKHWTWRWGLGEKEESRMSPSF